MGCEPGNFTVSLVRVPDAVLEDVARVAGTTVAAVRAYMSDPDWQDPALFRAFERHQVFPVGKFPGVHRRSE